MSQVTCQSQTRRCCRPQGRRAPQHPTDIRLTRNGEVKRRAADAYYPSALIYSPRAGCQVIKPPPLAAKTEAAGSRQRTRSDHRSGLRRSFQHLRLFDRITVHTLGLLLEKQKGGTTVCFNFLSENFVLVLCTSRCSRQEMNARAFVCVCVHEVEKK